MSPHRQASSSTTLPDDWEHPRWGTKWKTHNWRNHVTDEVAEMWQSFSAEQKKALARQAQALAEAEEWN